MVSRLGASTTERSVNFEQASCLTILMEDAENWDRNRGV